MNTHLSLTSLEHRIDELIRHGQMLATENQQLRAQTTQWQQERAQLLAQHAQCRTTIESMIQRLKSLEQQP